MLWLKRRDGLFCIKNSVTWAGQACGTARRLRKLPVFSLGRHHDCPHEKLEFRRSNVSSGHGRSWRPEKKVKGKDSRRVQIIFVSVVLVSLIGAVLFLVLRPRVPLLHFVVVSEHEFRSDDTAITPLPTGSTTFNASRLEKLAFRFREQEPLRISECETHNSIADFVTGQSLSKDESLIIYIGADAWCVPDKDRPNETVLELLPSKSSEEPVRFSTLLSSLKERNSAQTVMLLEFSGRNPGLASGALSDDVPGQIRREVESANIPGLIIICACEQGERSWEYVPEPLAKAAAISSDTTAKSASSGLQVALPQFEGTAFGYFLCKAIEDGKAGSAADLYETLKANVQPWVSRRFGESQTVWMVSADARWAQRELLSRARVKREPESAAEPEKELDAEKKDQKSVAEGEPGKEEGGADKKTLTSNQIDATAVARFKALRVRQKTLAEKTMVKVLFPADWLQLEINLTAAERFAMNVDRKEFDSLHDNVLHRLLNELEERTSATALSDEQQAVSEWLVSPVVSNVSQEDSRLLKRIRDDFSVDPEKSIGIRLPDEVEERIDFRRSVVLAFLKDLRELADTVTNKPEADRVRLMQQQVYLAQNLASRWPNKVLPEPIAAVREVLHGTDYDWLVIALKPLVRLTELRQQALLLAAGQNNQAKLMRRGPWSTIAPDVEIILNHLLSAERWLSLGKPGYELANDRLESAQKQLLRLKEQVETSERISSVKDAQEFEIPYLIQYFSLRLDETPLQAEELNQVQAIMAEAVISDRLSVKDFPEGPLAPAGLTRNHIEAMFALTRDFSAAEVTEADERHYLLLKRYVAERAAAPMSARDNRDLLMIPLLPSREKLLANMFQSESNDSSVSTVSANRSGIWVSFWSLRLARAVGKDSIQGDWEQWRRLVAASADPTAAIARSERALMASLLRERWTSTMQKLKASNNSEVFPQEGEIMKLLSRDVARRMNSGLGGNQRLYSGIQKSLSAANFPASSPSISVTNSDAEVSAENEATARVQISDAAEVYLLNEGLALTNTPQKADRNWWRVDVNAGASKEVEFALKLEQTPLAPWPLMLVAVNCEGLPVSMTTTTLLPSADNRWALEVVEVKEGHPERSISLEELQNPGIQRLKLPPTTLDSVTKMHAPVQLKIRLRHTKGTAKRVRLRVLHADKNTIAWSPAEPLVIPEGADVVDIPLVAPASAVAGAEAPPVASVPEFDISGGLIFEITPDDDNLPRKITSRLTLLPKLLEPERILQKPNPQFNAADGRLEIALERIPFDNSAALWPTTLPAQLVLSPRLQEFLQPGAQLNTLNVDGFTFQVDFKTQLEKALRDEGLEFGVSVAGIPHAWWWKLIDGIPVPLEGAPQVRAFLSVENDMEVMPISKSPDLLLGENWSKARMSLNAFLHGGQFDDGWSLNLSFLRDGQNKDIRIHEPPFTTRGRFVETVKITPGENGLWHFMTTTDGYSVATFLPAQYQLENGRYRLHAAVQKKNTNEDPATFDDIHLVLDNSAPEFRADDIRLEGSRTNVKGVLKGKVRIVDSHSGVKAVRVGLNPAMLTPVVMTQGDEVNVEFQLESLDGFPKLEQGETDTEETASLVIEAENFAGIKRSETKTVVFFLPGKKSLPAKMDKTPGTIIVKFKSSSKFDVAVKGDDNGVAKELPNSSGSAVFSDLPPGSYTIEWKPVQGSLGNGTDRVVLPSGKTIEVGPGK